MIKDVIVFRLWWVNPPNAIFGETKMVGKRKIDILNDLSWIGR